MRQITLCLSRQLAQPGIIAVVATLRLDLCAYFLVLVLRT